MSEKIRLIPLPIMDVIAGDVVSAGEYRQHLGVDGLKELVVASIGLAVEKYRALNPTICPTLVEIEEDDRIIIDTGVAVETPRMRIGVRANWMNGGIPGELKITGFTRKSDFSDAAIVLLLAYQTSAKEVDRIVETGVRNPNKMLGEVIRGQMFLRGVKTTAAGFVIENQTVRVVVKGEKIQ
jgi:hypothetical protein